MSKNCAVILAAGEIDWVLDATEASGVNDTILVVGAYGEQLVDHCGDRSAICWQRERLGTGHAVMMALDYLNASDAENVLILNGDAPFMDAATIAESLALHEANGNAVTVISARLDDPFGYGRIVQGADGSFERISLGKLTTDNAAHEYYLTDTIYILKQEGKNAGVFVTENADVVLGANDREQLQALNDIAARNFPEAVK